MPRHLHGRPGRPGCTTCGDQGIPLATYTSSTTYRQSTSRVCQPCYSRLRRWERALALGKDLDGILGPFICGGCVRALLAEVDVLPPP